MRKLGSRPASELTAFTVCFINTHAKGDCGYDYFTALVLPLLLNVFLVSIVHSCVEVTSHEALKFQPLGNLLGFCTGVTVDNTCFVWILLHDKLNDPGFHISLLRYDLIPQIGAVEGL